jgi:hypothetical protein
MIKKKKKNKNIPSYKMPIVNDTEIVFACASFTLGVVGLLICRLAVSNSEHIFYEN